MNIAVAGMLDEREDGLRLIKEQIEKSGHKTILIDFSIGTGGIKTRLKADVTCEEVATAGGMSMDKIRETLSKEREKATSAMAGGLAKKVLELYKTGELKGIIAVGGMTGTFITLTAMKTLPFGLPKLLISSVTAMPAYAGRLAEYFSLRDITVMHSVVDTVGLNPLVRSLMINGAGAICGMVEKYEAPGKDKKPSIAITEFGFCDKGAQYVRSLLEQSYNFVSFHATGLGDRAVEDLVGQGLFEGFVDMVPANLGEYILGGNRASRPDRLEAACKQGIPYILSPCGFDMISCGPIERKDKADPLWVSRKLAERKLLVQDSIRVQARTNADEMQIIARAVAEKLNKHRNKKLVKFVIPTRGFSSLSVEGGALYDPDTDKVFVNELREKLDPEIRVIEVDTHINTTEFARAIAEALAESFKLQAETR
ncbi:MAG: Tm-1-like ATP-binding domain-containing protein [Spirochaetes bacterium]|nr:Tm-1-like ATP-binding domain-containing protein [Spirochaetota bacterium]